jgi:hypothetical protein
MGVDKNSSPKRELSLTPNSQPRIPTRVCQGHVVTTDVPTLGTNPKRSQSRSTNQEAKDLAILQQSRRTVRGPGRTVRDHHADGPHHTADGPLNTNRTTQPAPQHADGPYHVLVRSASNSCRADCPRRPCGLSAKPLSTKSHWPTGSKRRRSRTREEHLGKTLHADGPHPPRGRSARCKPAREQQPENQLESTLPPILPRISQTVEALEERFGEDVKRP